MPILHSCLKIFHDMEVRNFANRTLKRCKNVEKRCKHISGNATRCKNVKTRCKATPRPNKGKNGVLKIGLKIPKFHTWLFATLATSGGPASLKAEHLTTPSRCLRRTHSGAETQQTTPWAYHGHSNSQKTDFFIFQGPGGPGGPKSASRGSPRAPPAGLQC